MSHARRVDVFLRGSVPFDARARQLVILARLQALRARGLIDEVRIDTWANRITDSQAETELARTALAGFERWATAHHASLTPGFQSHECYSGFTGQRFRTTVFPVVCLAVYDDERLVAVYPHSTESGCVTALDGLALLEADVDIDTPASARATGRAKPDHDRDRSAA